MHDTAEIAGKLFLNLYGKAGMTIIDIGGKDVNGSPFREYAKKLGLNYYVVDMDEDPSVDIVVKPTEKLPFNNETVDLIISTSCFEHDPCFWITFREMTRIIKKDGFIYVNAPKNEKYHSHPGDNWRFYYDAGQALAFWSSYQMNNEEVYPVKVIETFHINPLNDIWIDFVCIWQRTDNKETEITIKPEIYNNKGLLQTALNTNGLTTTVKF